MASEKSSTAACRTALIDFLNHRLDFPVISSTLSKSSAIMDECGECKFIIIVQYDKFLANDDGNSKPRALI